MLTTKKHFDGYDNWNFYGHYQVSDTYQVFLLKEWDIEGQFPGHSR